MNIKSDSTQKSAGLGVSPLKHEVCYSPSSAREAPNRAHLQCWTWPEYAAEKEGRKRGCTTETAEREPCINPWPGAFQITSLWWILTSASQQKLTRTSERRLPSVLLHNCLENTVGIKMIPTVKMAPALPCFLHKNVMLITYWFSEDWKVGMSPRKQTTVPPHPPPPQRCQSVSPEARQRVRGVCALLSWRCRVAEEHGRCVPIMGLR